MTTQEILDAATIALHETPCPGCGLEPEVKSYLRDEATKVRRGYYCTCGAVVVDGLLTGHAPGAR